jgi:hypothetical protein
VLYFNPLRYNCWSQSLELTREQAIQLWAQKRQQGWQPWEPQWLPPPAPAER